MLTSTLVSVVLIQPVLRELLDRVVARRKDERHVAVGAGDALRHHVARRVEHANRPALDGLVALVEHAVAVHVVELEGLDLRGLANLDVRGRGVRGGVVLVVLDGDLGGVRVDLRVGFSRGDVADRVGDGLRLADRERRADEATRHRADIGVSERRDRDRLDRGVLDGEREGERATRPRQLRRRRALGDVDRRLDVGDRR